MEIKPCVIGLRLIFFIGGVCLSPDPFFLVGTAGGLVSFDFPRMEYGVLYRASADGDLLLANSSQPKGPQPEGYKVTSGNPNGYFLLENLLDSHSGEYRVEVWNGGNVTENRTFHLTICAKSHNSLDFSAGYGSNVTLCRRDSTLGNASALQLYEVENGTLTLVLDTSASQEPLREGLRGRLQVDFNSSQITLIGVGQSDNTSYYCLIWRGPQCQHLSTTYLFPQNKFVFAHEEENVTLQCISTEELPGQVYWSTPIGYVTLNDQRHEGEVMYMLNGNMTRDYSLIIPSMSEQYSGVYTCVGHQTIVGFTLHVCFSLPSLDVMFHQGEDVLLEGSPQPNNSLSLIAFRHQKHQEEGVPIDMTDTFIVYVCKDLKGKVTVSNHSLIISNLTVNHSGLYTYTVLRGPLQFLYSSEQHVQYCSNTIVRLLYRDPFGVDSPFYRAYASVLGCVLLGLVAAVVWTYLRSRRAEHTSGCQSREVQQGGDENLYDNVEVAEDGV